ncbi:phenylacetate--CoA ligase [Neobacillus bataviensis LMG 21833]|uniref:Phenylacetate--CoA ligase n=1 Tax=Neobacillus bataviensis LMG 21833 TaxID=1117379 RepID=K6EB52_9BACI|nr:AMP-binding protein [Neobacillus bataviensis]EKN70651.1 phenylacetate--CoA ligase [Neobacillus bataviensis LMG 21833]
MRKIRYVTTALNTMTNDEILQLRETKLLNQMKYCYRNSEYYQNKFKEIGVYPQEIKSIEEFRKLPIMMNKNLERSSQQESMDRHGHPFGMHFCCSPDDVFLTATTSGTTGIPTFSYTLAQQDINNLSKAVSYMLEYARVSPGDRILFSHALGIYATSAVLPGIRHAGVLPIDVDVRAGTAAILQYARLTKPTAAMMTPSLAEHLIQKAPEIIGTQVSDFNLSALLTVGEIAIGIPEVKQKIEEAYGCRVYDWIGPIGGSLAFSCDSDEYYGMHCVTPDFDLYPYDLVDPDTKQSIDMFDGVIGEAIYTSLDRIAVPMLRMASGDIVQVFTKECPGCGFKGLRVKVVGRSDDMLIVKGANVYPAAIKQVITTFRPDVTGEIRIVLDQAPPRVTPPLKVKVEYGANMDSSNLFELEEKIKEKLRQEVRVTPEIIWCPSGTLEKSMAKTPVFEKNY